MGKLLDGMESVVDGFMLLSSVLFEDVMDGGYTAAANARAVFGIVRYVCADEIQK